MADSEAGSEPSKKKQATEANNGVSVKVEPGVEEAGTDGGVLIKKEDGRPLLERAKDAKRKVREALLKRKRYYEDELKHIETAGNLLDYAQAVQRLLGAQAAGGGGAANAEGKGGEKAPGLSDAEKLILQKAKAIEAKARFKAKWPEPPRRKVHHDYLLEEMSWLATDFRQERKWKMAVAKKVAYAVMKYHSQKQKKEERADKDKENKARKNASKIAREVTKFWKQIETLAQHKQQVQVDMEKKKVLGRHLDFLVDQTEKYSSMIAQDLAAPSVHRPLPDARPDDGGDADSVTPSRSGAGDSTGAASPAISADAGDPGDAEFNAVGDDEDDEETMEEAEKELDKEEVKEEVSALAAEQDMPLEELLAKYGYAVGDEAEGQEEEDEEDEDGEEEEAGEGDKEKEKAEGTAAMVEDKKEGEKKEGGGEGEKEKEVGKEGEKKEGGEEGGLSAEAKDVAEVARTLAPTGHTLATTQVKTTVPFLLSAGLKMREYQHIALDWMIALYDKGLNGILADEMGLGKTIMTISVLAHLACERGIWGPHLIVVPTSLLLNWEMELKRWCPSFKVLTYYGSQKERKAKRQGWSKANSFHVCITSYKMVVQDQKMFRRKRWKYMILDEAHNIKNFQSQRWQTLLGFRTKRRLLLTGTPLQNNLMELWSLLHFLMPHIFTSHSEFRDWFANPLMSMVEGTSQVNDTLVQRLHSVLRPFILRRLKKDVETQLPNKHEHVVPCRLSKRQRCLYDDFLEAGSTQAKLQSGNLLEVINVLMQLRKVCNHPDLFEERPIVSPFDAAPPHLASSAAAAAACAWDATQHVSLRSLNFLLEEFEGMSQLDALETQRLAPSHLKIVELTGVPAEGGAAVASAASVGSGRAKWGSVAEYKAHLAERRQAFKAHSLTQLLRANAARCERAPLFGADLCRLVRGIRSPAHAVQEQSRAAGRHLEYTEALRRMVLTVEERVFGWGGKDGSGLDRALRSQWDVAGKEVPSLMDMLTNYVCTIPKARAAPLLVSLSRRSLLPAATTALESPEALATARAAYSAMNEVIRPAHVRQQLYFPDKRLLQYDCGKLQVLDEMLRRLKSGGHRVLMFTQMSKVLDVVETFLSFHGHTYVRLDGSTKIETRQMLVERFNQDPKIFMFISSTRAGGVGINLTGADTVIFYDSDWNPAMDRQAQDRCHRIGQTREVNIYRLVSEHTVEENILKKANQKLHLETLALKDGATSLFNPEMFKKIDVRELFEDPSAAHPAEEANPLAHLQQGAAQPSKEKPKAEVMGQKVITDKEWEMAIANAEDERDVEAMKMAKQEEKEELADFNEDDPAVPADGAGAGAGEKKDGAGERGESDEFGSSRVEAVSLALESELTRVQRYALHFLEKEYSREGIALVQGVSFDKDKWERDQLRRIRDQDADRLYDEDEILFYEVSGCSQQVYREHVARLSLGCERSYLEFGSCYAPPDPDDDINTFVTEPMFSDAGLRAANKKNQRPGPPNAKQLKIKFIVPGQGQPGQKPLPGQPGHKVGPGRPGQQGQRQEKKKQISAGEVPWSREEDGVLREGMERFHGSAGQGQPIRTWHLYASYVNASIPARGRFRTGKHCMDYWNMRLAPNAQGQGDGQQGAAPPKPPQYPPRQQTYPPTREDNLAVILRTHKPAGPKQGAGAGPSTKQQREAMQQVAPHDSHRSALTAAAQQMQVNASLLTSPSELIKRLASKPPAQPSQPHHHAHPSPMQRPGPAGQVPDRHGAPAGMQRPGQLPQQGAPRPGMMPGQRPGMPGGAGGAPTAASKMAGPPPHPSHAAAMQAGRPGVGQKPPGPVPGPGGAPTSTVVMGSSGASAQMAHANSVVGMQRPTPGAGPGPGPGPRVSGPMGGASVHQQQLQAQQQQQQRMQQQAVQHQAARQAAIAQQQMRATGPQGQPQPHVAPVASVPPRPGAYSQPMPPPGTGGLMAPGPHQHPQSTMAQAMQHQAQAMAQASTRQRKPKGGR